MNKHNIFLTITFIVNTGISGEAYIKIYNSAGILVEITRVNVIRKGKYQIKWNAEKYSSGVYFYSLDFGDEILFSGMMLIK